VIPILVPILSKIIPPTNGKKIFGKEYTEYNNPNYVAVMLKSSSIDISKAAGSS
jgi:hypothetical protein